MRFLNTRSFKIIAGIVLLLLLYVECVLKHNKDFDIFIGASRLVFEGSTCYDVWIKSGTSGLKYYYSPLFATLLFPLKDVPQVFYNLVWMLINFTVIFRVFSLFRFFLPLAKVKESNKNWFYLLCFISSVRFILDNLDLGQMTFILVWGTMESLRLVKLKKHLSGAALLALIINIKLIPLCFLPYLIYKREFRAVTLTLAFCLLYLFLPAIFIGYHFNNQLLEAWLNTIANTTHNSIIDDIGRPSLSSVIPSLLMETTVQYSLKRNILDLDAQTVGTVLNAVRCLLLLVLVFLFGRPFKKLGTPKELFFDLSLICIVTPLFFPHQGKYAYFYLLPAFAYCLYALMRLYPLKNNPNYRKIWKKTFALTAIAFACTTLTTDGLIGRPLSNFTEYLHFILYGALALLGAMTCLRPKSNYWVNK